MNKDLIYNCVCTNIKLHGYSVGTFAELEAQGLEEYMFTKTGTRIPYTTLLLIAERKEYTILDKELHALAQSCGHIDWNAYKEHMQNPQNQGKTEILKLILYIAAFVFGIFCIVKTFQLFI